MMKKDTFKNKDVETVFATYPESVRESLLFIRKLIFEESENNKNIGTVSESLKWGQPSYATKPKTGSPIRLGIEKKTPDQFGLYVHCGTRLIEDFKHIYPAKFTYSGSRAVLFRVGDDQPEKELRHIINIALTYHLN